MKKKERVEKWESGKVRGEKQSSNRAIEQSRTRIKDQGSRIKFLSAVICVLLSAVICVPAYAAGLEISVSGGGWALGDITTQGAEYTSDQWTVHASSDGTEDIWVKVSDTGGWTAGGASNDRDTYGLKETTVDPDHAITGENTLWKDDAASGDHPFALWFQAPSSWTTTGDHTFTVTLTVSDWQAAVAWDEATCEAIVLPAPQNHGIWYDLNDGSEKKGCWIYHNVSGLPAYTTSCTQICGAYGLLCLPTNWNREYNINSMGVCLLLGDYGSASHYAGIAFCDGGQYPTCHGGGYANCIRLNTTAQDCDATGYRRACVCEPPPDACGDLTTMYDSRDGKTYNIVAIGDQCWMKENLAYDNGCSSVTWVNNADRGWCGQYTDGPFPNEGLLYQKSVAKLVCPSGWHLPSDADFSTLIEGLATPGCDTPGRGERCSPAGKHLSLQTLNGDNSSGFTGTLAGLMTRQSGPTGFIKRGELGWYYTTDYTTGEADFRVLKYNWDGVGRDGASPAYGASVRCVKD